MQASRFLFLLCVMQLSAFAAECFNDRGDWVNYDPNTEICCEGYAIDKNDHTYGCCDNKRYEISKSICCGENVIDKNDPTDRCCGGDQKYDKNSEGCCNDTTYFKDTNICCDGKIEDGSQCP